MRAQNLSDNVPKKENIVKGICLGAPGYRPIFVCLAFVTVCSLFLLTTLNVQANTVTIHDQAGVLDVEKIQTEVAKVPVPLLIYTTETFTGDQDALDLSTRAQLPDQNTIAIGIDTVHRHVSLEAGTNVQLSNSQATDAVSAFRSTYDNGGDYTGATIAALDSLYNALSGSGMTPLGMAVAILLPIGVVVLLVFAIRRRRTSGRNGPPHIGSRRSMGIGNTPYPYYGAIPPTGTPPSGNYGGGAGGGFGGGAGGSF